MLTEVNPNIKSEFENILRPRNFKDYIGQEKLKNQLNVYITAAKKRGEKYLDHMLISGPPGLGKTTVAHIVANEMKSNIVTIMAPSIDKPADIVKALITLEDGDILFIDEIHALKRNCEEILYSAMEDFKIGIMTQDKAITINVERFTLIGATTRKGLISSPLLDRFGIVQQIEYYNNEDLEIILKANAKKIKISFNNDAIKEIALRSRGTPRIANKLLSRIKDYAQVHNNSLINIDIARKTLDDLGVDKFGLEESDRRIILTMYTDLKNRPVGIDTISKTSGEDKETLERVIEPFLIREKLIIRTSKGRELTAKGQNYADELICVKK